MTKRVPIDLLASNFEARDTKENTTSDPETSLIINNRETSFTCQLNSSPYQIVPTKETVKCVCVCVCVLTSRMRSSPHGIRQSLIVTLGI